MSITVRPEVYQRIVLAKALLKEGSAACSNRNDRISFTRGLLLLHDAAEAALGAIADHVHAKLPDRTYLLDYFQLIQEADPQKRSLPYRAQLRNLNALRVSAKHLGILPDPNSNAHFPSTVEAFVDELSQTYLSLPLAAVSLKNLIRNQEVLTYVNGAEQAINDGDIERGLIQLAYAMYHVCEAGTIPWISYPYREEKRFQFTEPYTIEQTVNLLQHGVDPYLYHRFKNLTPIIARDRETRELVYYWDNHYGHPANWTPRNAYFCLAFCVDAALRFQRQEDEGYSLIPYRQVYEDVVEPSGDQLILWNQSVHATSPVFGQPVPVQRAPNLVLKRGESIVGWATESKDNLDEWFIISADIPAGPQRSSGYGYALKTETKITRREIQHPKEITEADDGLGS